MSIWIVSFLSLYHRPVTSTYWSDIVLRPVFYNLWVLGLPENVTGYETGRKQNGVKITPKCYTWVNKYLRE